MPINTCKFIPLADCKSKTTLANMSQNKSKRKEGAKKNEKNKYSVKIQNKNDTKFCFIYFIFFPLCVRNLAYFIKCMTQNTISFI